MSLNFIIVIDLEQSQYGRDRLIEFLVLYESILCEITRLALLAKEVFSDLVLDVDPLIHITRVSSVSGHHIIASLGLGPLGTLEIRLFVALLSFFLVRFNFFVEFVAYFAQGSESFVPLVVAQTFWH